MDTMEFLNEIAGRSGPGVRVEGDDDRRGLPPLIYEEPAVSLMSSKKRVPLLTGVTSAETSRAVFGVYSGFLTNQLNAVSDFINKDVIGGLQNVVFNVSGLIPGLSSTVKNILPVFNYYQATVKNSLNIVTGLAKIAEATGDALFNFPAYQSVKSWSSGGSAFLYSFDYVGNLSKGWHFLPGVPLAAQPKGKMSSEEEETMMKGPSHGDELAYIFEPLDSDGKPMGGEVSSTDARVRNTFLGLITEFAHNMDSEEKKQQTDWFGIAAFTGKDQGQKFLKIGEKISYDKDFRFCQIGIWGGMSDRLNDNLCKNLLGVLTQPLAGLSAATNNLGGILGNTLNAGSLIANNNNKPKQPPQIFNNLIPKAAFGQTPKPPPKNFFNNIYQ